MTVHRFVAVDAKGIRCSGAEDAVDQAALVDRLMARGLTPLSIRPARRLTGLTLGLGRTDLSRRDRLTLLQDLGNLAMGSVPIDKALELVADTAASPRIAALVEEARRRVRQGESLSSALAAPGSGLAPETLAVIAAGEASGTLAASLERLVDLERRRARRRERLISALSYPALVFVLAVGALMVITGYVLPKFEDAFAEAGQRLPPLTAAVLAGGRFLAESWPWLCLGLGLAGAALHALLRRPSVRQRFDKAVLAAGPLGRLVRDGEIASFVRTLATLLAGGVPLAKALDLARTCLVNGEMQRVAQALLIEVRTGRRLGDAMAAQPIMPIRVTRLVALAEEGGRVAQALAEIADMQDREYEAFLGRVLDLLPPVLTLLLGGLVGTIVIALVSGVVSINDLAQ